MDIMMTYGFLAALLAILTRALWTVPGAALWGVSRWLMWLLLALALVLFALSTVQSVPLVQTFRR